jgi:carbamoyl-phosphate synthase small subunit
VTVVPAQTPAAEVLALNPDGVFLSNGPGDPEPCDYAIAAIRKSWKDPVRHLPGPPAAGLASGAKTMKMGSATTVPTTRSGPGPAGDDHQPEPRFRRGRKPCRPTRATHKSLFDGTLQGIARTDVPAFCFQGHPKRARPDDVAYLFDRFI